MCSVGVSLTTPPGTRHSAATLSGGIVLTSTAASSIGAVLWSVTLFSPTSESVADRAGMEGIVQLGHGSPLDEVTCFRTPRICGLSTGAERWEDHLWAKGLLLWTIYTLNMKRLTVSSQSPLSVSLLNRGGLLGVRLPPVA